MCPFILLRTYSNRPGYCLTEFSEHFERYIILRINKDDLLVWKLNEKTITGRCIIIAVISSNNRNKTDVSDLISTTKSKMFYLIPPYPSGCCLTCRPYIAHVWRCCNYAHLGSLPPAFRFLLAFKECTHEAQLPVRRLSGAGPESCLPADYEINRERNPAPGTLRRRRRRRRRRRGGIHVLLRGAVVWHDEVWNHCSSPVIDIGRGVLTLSWPFVT